MQRFKPCSVVGCDRNAHRDGAGKRGFCSLHYGRWLRHGDPHRVDTKSYPAQEWVKAHASYEGDDCLRWPFATGANGYGRVVDPRSQRLTPASRFMCEVAHGPPPTPRHEAAHNCGQGNAGCVNPRHLRWATPKENQADSVVHGTRARGERQGQARLSAADVQQIRKLCGTMTLAEIGQRFGVAVSHVCHIHRGKAWGWLPPSPSA